MQTEKKKMPDMRLTRTQREAVSAIRRFRRQRKVGSTWLVGDRRLSQRIVSDLERLRLVREETAAGIPVLTYIGILE